MEAVLGVLLRIGPDWQGDLAGDLLLGPLLVQGHPGRDQTVVLVLNPLLIMAPVEVAVNLLLEVAVAVQPVATVAMVRHHLSLDRLLHMPAAAAADLMVALQVMGEQEVAVPDLHLILQQHPERTVSAELAGEGVLPHLGPTVAPAVRAS